LVTAVVTNAIARPRLLEAGTRMALWLG